MLRFVAGGGTLLAALADQIGRSGALAVVAVAAVMVVFQIRDKWGAAWRDEAAAQKERADRLQDEKEKALAHAAQSAQEAAGWSSRYEEAEKYTARPAFEALTEMLKEEHRNAAAERALAGRMNQAMLDNLLKFDSVVGQMEKTRSRELELLDRIASMLGGRRNGEA